MINGIVNVYKEKGFTSHDAVAKLRGILHQRKIGHTGTLDPDATGVLPVCLGKATKVCDLLTDETKSYEAVLLLGIDTDTQDVTGRILKEREVTVTEQEVLDCLNSFVGAYMQVPPMYSALKVNGKKLYEYARAGIEVERAARKVHFYDITPIEIDLPRVRFSVTCSKGTYIRTLCYDIGEKLGCCGCMESLVRTRVGIFPLAGSFTLSEIEEVYKTTGEIPGLVSLDQMFVDRAELILNEDGSRLAHNGNVFHVSYIQKKYRKDWKHLQEVRVYDSEGAFVGLYHYREGHFYLNKMFYERQ